MYGQYHEVPYNSKIKETIIGPFSWSQLLWLAPACYLSFQIASKVPKLPIGDSIIWSRIHWFFPIIVAIIFITFKHPKTNLTLSKYLIVMIKFHLRQKVFYYRRENMPVISRKKSGGEK